MTHKKKWQSAKCAITWEAFQKMSPDDIIYDSLANRATTAGILWGMPYRTVRDMIAYGRYKWAMRIPE